MPNIVKQLNTAYYQESGRKVLAMNNQPGFFDFAAEVGLTKHIGGVEATDALAGLCHIGQTSHVLDVGCGVGQRLAILPGATAARSSGWIFPPA